MKNSNAPSGIEPATFWLVAQCLNQLRYHMPHKKQVVVFYSHCCLYVSIMVTPARMGAVTWYCWTLIILFSLLSVCFYHGHSCQNGCCCLVLLDTVIILFSLLSVCFYHGHSCQNGCCYLVLLATVIILIFHFQFLVFCWN